jgi:hypothetical protein
MLPSSVSGRLSAYEISVAPGQGDISPEKPLDNPVTARDHLTQQRYMKIFSREELS